MNNDQLATWLRERGVSEDAISSVIVTADQVKELYRESTEMGAATKHEDWLEEISLIGERCSNSLDQVVWFLLGLADGPIAFILMSN